MNPASREPAALYIGLIAPIAACLAAFVFAASPETQTIVNAAALAVAGAVTAFVVRSDNLVPAVTGAISALVSVGAALGLGLDSAQQASLVVALGAIAAVIVRDRVTAVPASAVHAAG